MLYPTELRAHVDYIAFNLVEYNCTGSFQNCQCREAAIVPLLVFVSTQKTLWLALQKIRIPGDCSQPLGILIFCRERDEWKGKGQNAYTKNNSPSTLATPRSPTGGATRHANA